VGYFIEPVLKNHDPAAVETICYYTGSHPDAATERMRRLAHRWVELGPNRAPDWIPRIRADQVDILVELSGHSHGNCLPMLAHRLAPIQATYIGWPATTGLPAMDWRIIDSITDPPGSESACTEKLARLDGCFLCYRPPDAAPAPAPGPAARGEPVTFGSFNATFKISDTTIDLWSKVLQAVPHSRLLLKASGLARAPVAGFIRDRFESRGVSGDRLTLLDYIDDAGGHLGAYSRIDVALDTVPYGGRPRRARRCGWACRS
jgi:predicted O-linked N-acetylglucosamine transferase (SPINDLY family)